MPRRLSIQEHLSVDQLERNYRDTYDPIERTRYQIIWLLAKGKTTKEVSSVTGYCLEAIRQIARRYNQQGKEGLVDRRHQHPGPKGFLSDERQAQLEMALQEKAPDGGLWNGRKVGDWLTELIDYRVDRRRGWEYLRSMRYRLRIPRPEHYSSATPTEQEEWKKKLSCRFEQLKAEYPEATVEIWAMDEHRLGLKPIFRRVWTPIGVQPTAEVNWRFQWFWVYGFVHPQSGETYWWLKPLVNITVFNQVLADLAEHFSLGKNKQMILVLDRAGWHSSKNLKIPLGLNLEFLPAHTPELQPAERLWPIINEPICNQTFESLSQMEDIVNDRCINLMKQRSLPNRSHLFSLVAY